MARACLALRSRRTVAVAVAALALGPTARAQDAPPAPPTPPATAAPALPDPDKAGSAKPFAVDFEEKAGRAAPPEGFIAAGGEWTVVETPKTVGLGHVLRQDRKVESYATIFATGSGRSLADGRASVRFLPESGRDDASGGIVFRARGADDYYLARANALEDNLRLYVVKKGVRWQLATVTVDPPKMGEWHTLEVEFRGDLLRATLDGKPKAVVEAKDNEFPSGWCGLWTKGDSTTIFDDLSVQPDASLPTTPSRPTEPSPPAPPPTGPPGMG